MIRGGNIMHDGEGDVLQAALARIRDIYQSYEHVIVTWSGGKDSTVALNLTVQVAEELDRLPVEVWFLDDEILDPDTIDFAERTRQRPPAFSRKRSVSFMISTVS